MFRAWIIRQHNTVWVCKLADIVTSLWLGIIKLDKELFYVTPIFLELSNKIIFGINDFDKSTTTVKEEGNKTLQQKTTDKYNRFHIVT